MRRRVGENPAQCLRAAPLPRRIHYSSLSVNEPRLFFPHALLSPRSIEKKRFKEVRERSSARRGVSTFLSNAASPCSRHGLLTESDSRHCFSTESPVHNSAPLYSQSRSFNFFFLFVAPVFVWLFLFLFMIFLFFVLPSPRSVSTEQLET